MRFIFYSLALSLFAAACSVGRKAPAARITSNELLERLYLKDLSIRALDAETDTVNLEKHDQIHREQVFQLLAENKVITAKDKMRAAWILQHTAAKFCDGELTSTSAENFLLAYKLSSTALAMLEKDRDTLTIQKENLARIVALNYDRYLLFTKGYQKFGTQFIFDDHTQEMLLAPIDTTLASDAERAKHHVEPLKTLLAKNKYKPLRDE